MPNPNDYYRQQVEEAAARVVRRESNRPLKRALPVRSALGRK